MKVTQNSLNIKRSFPPSQQSDYVSNKGIDNRKNFPEKNTIFGKEQGVGESVICNKDKKSPTDNCNIITSTDFIKKEPAYFISDEEAHLQKREISSEDSFVRRRPRKIQADSIKSSSSKIFY